MEDTEDTLKFSFTLDDVLKALRKDHPYNRYEKDNYWNIHLIDEYEGDRFICNIQGVYEYEGYYMFEGSVLAETGVKKEEDLDVGMMGDGK